MINFDSVSFNYNLVKENQILTPQNGHQQHGHEQGIRQQEEMHRLSDKELVPVIVFDFEAYKPSRQSLISQAKKMRAHHRSLNKAVCMRTKRTRRCNTVTNCPHVNSKHYAKGMCD